MPRKRAFSVLVVALTLGAIFAVGTYHYVQAVPATSTLKLPTTQVVVAGANLDVGAALRLEDLRTIQWPAASVPTGTFSKPEELVGRGLIAPVVEHEPILPGKLASKEAGAGLPPIIPEGMRAVSVRVNDVIGVAGYILPGNHVDVLVDISPTEQHADVTSKVILTDVQVLTAGTRVERDVEKDKPITVSVVTLLVDPPQAEKLTLAATEGKIQLALRNPLDKGAPETTGIRPAVLLGKLAAAPVRRVAGLASKPASAPQAPALPTIEIIRGDKRTQEVAR